MISIFSPLCFLQEMQSKMDALRRELDDQRDKDGGVFISEEKKSEMEEKIAQLDKLRKEHANLTVSGEQTRAMVRFRICESKLLRIRVQLFIFLPSVEGDNSDKCKTRITNPTSVYYLKFI